MKILVLGDIHLGKSNHLGKSAELGSLNSRIQDQLNILNWGYNLCIEKQIHNIIIVGDVYNDWRPHPTLINIFMSWLTKCKNASIQVDIVMGNHDIIRSGSFVSSALDLINTLELENAKFHKDFTRLEFEDFTIILAPFRDKRMYDVKTTEEAYDCLKKDFGKICETTSDKTKICLGHFAIEGSLSIGDEIADSLNELYVSPEMFNWFDYVWMGHIHHPQIIKNKNPYLAHIGSIDRTDFSKTEVEAEKISIILDSDLDNKFEQLTIPIRALLPINIDVQSTQDSTITVLQELKTLSSSLHFKDSIVRLSIKLHGADLDNIDRKSIEKFLYQKLGVFYISELSESRVVVVSNIDSKNQFDNSMSLTESINKWAINNVQEKDQEEFVKFAHSIRSEYEEKVNK
jgi:exonuclease SbcD